MSNGAHTIQPETWNLKPETSQFATLDHLYEAIQPRSFDRGLWR